MSKAEDAHLLHVREQIDLFLHIHWPERKNTWGDHFLVISIIAKEYWKEDMPALHLKSIISP